MDSDILFSYQNGNSLNANASTEDVSEHVHIHDHDHNIPDDLSSRFEGEDMSDGELEAFYSDNEEELPDHACSYCGIHTFDSVVQCAQCNKWFCNGKGDASSSHIVTHLVMTKHNSVKLHPESDLGDETLECYNCCNKNVFVLGLIAAKTEAVMVMLCRLPCSQAKDSRWETGDWQPLIENREFVSWIARKPTEEESISARQISNAQISKLEAKWRLNKDATLADVQEAEEDVEEVEPILMRYEDAYDHQRHFAPLVKREADADKALKDSQALGHITIRWSIALNNKHLASFTLSTFESSGMKVAVGDEMILRYSGVVHAPWEGRGFIIRIPSAHQEEFTLELDPRGAPPPTNLETDFTTEFVWKGTSYLRMQAALKAFAVQSKSVSGYLFKMLLGHEVEPIEFDVKLPQKVSIDGFAELNVSQATAIKNVLRRPLSLIQGPPGTGKTVTSATIIYHLTKLKKNKNEKILVCAPSNIAVDHLVQKLDFLGLNVVRVIAKSREDVESSVEDLSLSSLVEKTAKRKLKKLMELKSELGELSDKDMKSYLKHYRRREKEILENADVVCCTCAGAGDRRLDNMEFRTVLIDEVTQASEPECFIPIVHGAKQLILVGDHQQLGPVILDKKAAEAGLRQSLFERLILLNQTPIRLEVQYRMNPCLAEYPSNMFYDGALQNGITKEDRRVASSTFPWPVPDTPMMFLANYGREEMSASGTSYLNRMEAMNCERIITRLFRDGVKPEQIGVITPYEGQRAYVVNYMTMNGSMDKELYTDVEVASVDAFQGREKDYIILSCVRANEGQIMGFLRDPRRLNVALTRAKYGLIILGNPRTLKRNYLWNQLLLHFREKGCLVEGPLDNLQLSAVLLDNPKRSKFNKNKADYEQFGFAASTINGGTAANDYDTASLVSFATQSDAAGSFMKGGNNSMYPAFFGKGSWPNFSDPYSKMDDNEGDDDNNEANENTYNPDRQINSSYAGKLEKIDDRLLKTFEALNINHSGFS